MPGCRTTHIHSAKLAKKSLKNRSRRIYHAGTDRQYIQSYTEYVKLESNSSQIEFLSDIFKHRNSGLKLKQQ